MVKTIGNPLTWTCSGMAVAGDAAGHALEALGSEELSAPPRTRDIGLEDIATALRKGVEDFMRFRTDVMFMALIYPVVGVLLSTAALDHAFLPLLFPMAAGFLLLGPAAAVGLYELSRRGETEADVGWGAAFAALRARNLGPLTAMTAGLGAVFLVWLGTAMTLYNWTLGPGAPASLSGFVLEVLMTDAGWAMIVLGTGIGACFAALVLAGGLISMPMLVDRRVGVPVAVATSLQVARRNPGTVAAWGAVVAVVMGLAMIPAFLGLIVALPVLGHATWHLYRAAVR